MKPVFLDYEEIQHVLFLIEEQQAAPIDWPYQMETAHVLADHLRTELLEGGVDEAKIVDGGELAFWTVPKMQPGTWEHAFADCLATLLTTFQTPYGTITDAEDGLYRWEELNSLKEKCIRILVADKSRFRLKAVHELKPLAQFAKPFKDNSEKIRKGGAIRVAIEKLLKKFPAMKNKGLWDTIAARPPKGWNFFENNLGRYAEGGAGENMGYRRFRNVCAEARGKQKA